MIQKQLLSIFLFFIFSSGFGQMQFVENKGQWNERVNYRGDFNGGSFYLDDQGFTVLLHHPEDIDYISKVSHGEIKELKDPFIFRSHSYKAKFVGALKAEKIISEKEFSSYNNYFLGNDKSKWASHCKMYGAVTYKNIYPNIDVRYYTENSKLKYDFIVYPGGNPDMIAINYEGAKISLLNKQIIIKTSVGDVKELEPYTYQSINGKTEILKSEYVLKDNIVSFKIKNYNPKSVLVIDPSIIFSTFTGSTADNWGYTATHGPDGSFYAAGIVFSSPGTGYPVSPGAFQTNYGGGVSEDMLGGYDIAIMKFSGNGSSRIYATYLGGSANEQPHSMIVDANGNLIVAGRTSSSNFPVTRNNIGPCGNIDIIISKFNAAGSALLGSVKIGGTNDDGVNIRPKYRGLQGKESLRLNYGDDARSEVILDNSNNIILASVTQSTDFPVQNSPIQTSFAGGLQDGVILKFNQNLSSLLFSTFFGGSENDACFVAGISPISNILYIGGATSSNNLPGNTSGTVNSSYQGGTADGFITMLPLDGSSIIKTTYQGTPATDVTYGLKFDRFGYPYTMGTTTGTWPVINATFKQTGAKQFITKLKPDLSQYVYSTVFGTNSSDPNISPVAFLVDRCENVYVSGWGGGLNNAFGYNTGNTSGLSEVNPLNGLPPPDGADFYFFVLEKNATSQLFGSHFGQNGGTGDHVDGGTSRFDENGVIYMAMCANCGRDVAFPTTPGVWATTNGSSGCNEAAVKIELDFSGVSSGIKTSINSVVGATKGCIPVKVDFSDTLQTAKTLYWNFGDGNFDTTTVFNTSHTYTVAGVYNVMLIAEDSSTCNIRDTSYIKITVGTKQASLDFTFRKTLPCESMGFVFTNTSTASSGSFGPRTFVWDFGDGSPVDTASLNQQITHNYAAAGTYFITLKSLDTSFCNTPIEITKRVSIATTVKAKFSTPSTGCLPYTAVFKNLSDAGTDFIWEFGDGTTSTDFEPVHTYSTAGVYNVRLIAIDSNTCNKKDTSAFFRITLYNSPQAIISGYSPNPPVNNTPISFVNGSVGAESYLWEFGDGETSNLRDPSHLYNAGGRFTVRLIAFNSNGCPDTATVTVNSIITPLLDVPNAFTPGNFGQNSVIKVMGFGIQKMNWRIYNRWGQLMFESNNIKLGWDGKYKGKLQPMDVYTYTLDVEFFDGNKLRKTGDITLLR